jgi:hypothetical protein
MTKISFSGEGENLTFERKEGDSGRREKRNIVTDHSKRSLVVLRLVFALYCFAAAGILHEKL